MPNLIFNTIPFEEFDYQTLLDQLRDYARPRDKITDLLRKRIIIRVKKGLYVFGDDYRKKPFSKELLANLIFGPSYVSIDYALHYYGLIPEYVQTVLSVTTGRSREFKTPVGRFVYRHLPLTAFRLGMDRIEIDNGRAFLMALPEKALADKLYLDSQGINLTTLDAMERYLEDHLRIDMVELNRMSVPLMDAAAGAFNSDKIRLLARLVHRRQKGKIHYA